jgi:hypothetical protein
VSQETKNSESPRSVRIQALSKTLDTIQNTLELFNGDMRKGAIIALNAVRKEYKIPFDEEVK